MRESVIDKHGVLLLEPHEFQLWWSDISDALDQIPHTWEHRYTKKAIKDRVLQGQLQVWFIGADETVKMFLFTQIASWPSGDRLEVVFACGREIDETLPIIDATMERFAQVNNCKSIDIIGRKGWERKLRSRGFRPQQVVLSRPVSDVRTQ